MNGARDPAHKDSSEAAVGATRMMRSQRTRTRCWNDGDSEDENGSDAL